MENGEEDPTGHTSKRSEVVQILAPSMWRLWGGIKWLGFPTPSSACAQRLLPRRIAEQWKFL